MNDYDSVETSGNEMEGEGQPVPCVHIYQMPDGSFGIERSEAPAPEGLQTAGSMEEVMQMAAEMLQGPSQAEEEDAMNAAKAGYGRTSKPTVERSGPEMLFGE